MPIRQIINVKDAAGMISSLLNSTIPDDKTKDGRAARFDWYKTDDSVKKWTSICGTNEYRKNAEFRFVFLRLGFARSFFSIQYYCIRTEGFSEL